MYVFQNMNHLSITIIYSTKTECPKYNYSKKILGSANVIFVDNFLSKNFLKAQWNVMTHKYNKNISIYKYNAL